MLMCILLGLLIVAILLYIFNEKCRSFFSKIPVLDLLLAPTLSDHRKVIGKFVFLWVLSFVPIMASFAVNNTVQDFQSHGFWYILNNAFPPSTRLICTFSILPSLIYLMREDRNSIENERNLQHQSGSQLSLRKTSVMTLIFIAIVVWIFSAMSYAHAINPKSETSADILSYLIPVFSTCVYLFSLLCWYVLILDPSEPVAINFTKERQDKESSLPRDLTEELHNDDN